MPTSSVERPDPHSNLYFISRHFVVHQNSSVTKAKLYTPIYKHRILVSFTYSTHLRTAHLRKLHQTFIAQSNTPSAILVLFPKMQTSVVIRGIVSYLHERDRCKCVTHFYWLQKFELTLLVLPSFKNG